MALTSLQIQSLVKAKIALNNFIAANEISLQDSSKYDIPCEGSKSRIRNAFRYLFAVDNAGYLTSNEVNKLLSLAFGICGVNIYITDSVYYAFLNSIVGQQYLVDSNGDGTPDIGTGGGIIPPVIPDPTPIIPPVIITPPPTGG